MLSTDLTWILAAVCAICAVYAAFLSFFARRDALQCAQWIEKNNKAAVSLKKIAELESQLTELTDAIDAYGVSLKKLRARIGMRKNRERGNGSDIPDPNTDPEGWKRYMRQKLHFEQRSK